MKNTKIIMILTITALTLYSNFSYSKQLSYHFKKIEPLLINKQYEKANVEFDKLKPSVKNLYMNKTFVSKIYKNTVKWLKYRDETQLHLNDAIKNLDSYYVYHNEVNKKTCAGYCRHKYHLPNQAPFSSEFVRYLNAELKKIIDKKHLVIADLNSIAKQKKKKENDAIKLKEEKQRQKRKKKERAYQQKINDEKNAIKLEIEKLNVAAKYMGYKGYENENIVSLIVKTQKKGGLEKYIDKVIGCHKLNKAPCKRDYPKLTAIQVLDHGVLYTLSEFSRGKYINFTVFSTKVDGKIYQEGQAFDDYYYVFRGMLSYKTALGINKTVPAFYKVDL